MQIFPEGETRFLIAGPAGALEIQTFAAKLPPKGVAVICHPNPIEGGTMDNKVVHTLSRAFHRKGLHAVRFNFRGIGKSEGEFGHTIGEEADLLAVLAWVKAVLPDLKLWLAGFSFGGYIAARGALEYPCHQLYSIAPGVTRHSFDPLMPTCPWVIIQGTKDEVIEPECVYAWFEKQQKLCPNMQLITLEASHFFHGVLIELRDKVEASLIF